MKNVFLQLVDVIKKNKSILMILFVLMMIVYIPFYVHYLPNPDTIVYNNGGYYRGIHWELSLGRWGIMLFDTIFGGINSPIMASVAYLCLVCMGVALIFDIFEVQADYIKAMVGVLAIILPFHGNILTYYYCSYDYGFAFLFMVLAVWLFHKCEHKWYIYIACAISVMLSFSLYQSYAGVGATLAVFIGISGILVHKEKGIDALKRMLGFAANAIVGGIMYIIVLNVGLKVLHVSMADYKGANDISVSNIISNLGPNVIKTYKEFVAYNFMHEYIGNHFLNNVFCLFLYLGIIAVMVAALCRVKGFVDKLIVVVLILLIPLGANIIDVIVPGSFLSIQASGGMAIGISVAFMIAQQILLQNNKGLFKRIALVLTCTAVIYSWTNMIQIETDALALEQSYNNGMYALEQINNTINSELEGRENMQVAIIGNPELGTYRLMDDIYELSSHYAVEGNFWDQEKNSWYTWTKLMKENYFSQYTFLSVDETLELAQNPEFMNMGIYPAKDSVKVIDNVLVLKVSDLNGLKE